MPRIHPAVLNMAYATMDQKSRRCWCWPVVAIVCAAFAYLLFMRVLAHP
jgi:hypothetical protein